MNKNQNVSELIDMAAGGDKESLEALIGSIQDMVFNLSLRMLGTTLLTYFNTGITMGAWSFYVCASYQYKISGRGFS